MVRSSRTQSPHLTVAYLAGWSLENSRLPSPGKRSDSYHLILAAAISPGRNRSRAQQVPTLASDCPVARHKKTDQAQSVAIASTSSTDSLSARSHVPQCGSRVVTGNPTNAAQEFLRILPRCDQRWSPT
ncbi:hypothetical protein R1flu_010165 [Riccia fluitans]|uniref:Uncharacterized protein n=1 Tax=Riccia fluitans TaxID=41844 RepID=A0ABD1Z4B2_9MARC